MDTEEDRGDGFSLRKVDMLTPTLSLLKLKKRGL